MARLEVEPTRGSDVASSGGGPRAQQHGVKLNKPAVERRLRAFERVVGSVQQGQCVVDAVPKQIAAVGLEHGEHAWGCGCALGRVVHGLTESEGLAIPTLLDQRALVRDGITPCRAGRGPQSCRSHGGLFRVE